MIDRRRLWHVGLTFGIAFMFLSAMFTVIPRGTEAASPESDFEFLVNDGIATVVGYSGQGGAIVIPSTLGGYPTGVIGSFAFAWCDNLISVSIPHGVFTIQDSAFYSCSLTSVGIPGSVTEIGDQAFGDCANLISVSIPDGVTSIGLGMFNGCERLVSVDIPDSVTSIGNFAFKECHSLGSVTIPYGVSSIGFQTFAWCTSLVSVVIPDSVISIGFQAFYDCISLRYMTIPNSVTSIDFEAFAWCTNLTHVDIPDSVTFLSEHAFHICYGLTSVTIPGSISSIGSYTFSECPCLTSVTIGEGITSIGWGAFWKCSALPCMVIPESVVILSDWSFADCPSLTRVLFRGDAPLCSANAFLGSNPNLVLYYLPTAEGFTTPTWCGIRTVCLSTTIALESDMGGNVGNVTVRVRGMIDKVASADLLRDGALIAHSTAVYNRFGMAYVTFDLMGKVPGLCDMNLVFADSDELTLEDSFTIIDGGGASFSADITGADSIRVGDITTYFVRIANTGYTDTELTIVRLATEGNVHMSIVEGIDEGTLMWVQDSWIIPGTRRVLIADESVDGPFSAIDLVVPDIPAQGSCLISVGMHCPPGTASGDGTKVSVYATNDRDFIRSHFQNYAEAYARDSGGSNFELAESYGWDNLWRDFEKGHERNSEIFLLTLSLYSRVVATLSGIEGFLSGAVVLSSFGGIWFLVGIPYTGYVVYKWLTAVQSMDPNDKAGPVGYGEDGFIAYPDAPLTYVIRFENLANATADAETIVITDVLSEDLDWSTFSFGPTSDDANVTAHFNSSTGTITWRFEGISLPPNIDPPEGEGWVAFSLKLKDGLASGTQIKNAASIVFDYNPAIVTNEVINTIDSTCPTSHIQAMDQDQPRDFTVSWTGNDAGSGVASWDVLVSVDGGAFILWLDRTANTSAEYHGEIGHNYSFYSIAKDNVGNIETASQSNKVSVTVSITDGFPADEVVILIAVLLVVAVGAWFLLARRRKK